MEDLSPHFSRVEFRCKGQDCCGNCAPISGKLIYALECLRASINEAFPDKEHTIKIQSGFRCLTYNRQINSKDTSQHVNGLAADIVVDGVSPLQVAYLAKRTRHFTCGGIGVYPTFVHLDVRPDGPARW